MWPKPKESVLQTEAVPEVTEISQQKHTACCTLTNAAPDRQPGLSLLPACRCHHRQLKQRLCGHVMSLQSMLLLRGLRLPSLFIATCSYHSFCGVF